MLEEMAVQRVVSQYSQSASRADWDTVLSLYMPDGVWEVPIFAARFEGRAAILEGLLRFSSPMTYIVQVNSPGLIELEGDRATSRCLINECGKYKDRDEGLQILGAYEDTLMKTNAGWKFICRTCIVHGMHNFPLSRIGD
jgi:ketosteroid isomerase-like protein